MPKSKRAKVVPLTKTTKKGKKQKETLIQELRDACDTFTNLYVFSVKNMRNITFKEVRKEWTGSRFFLGKNKVMALALGKTKATEYKKNLSQVTRSISGSRGLLLTNTPKDDVIRAFEEFKEEHYARSGFIATRDFILEAGPLPQPFSMEPTLRKLGLPTKLKAGTILLESKVTVCQKGDTLTPEQCKILEYFEQKMAIMRIVLHAHYAFQDNTFTKLKEDEEEESQDISLNEGKEGKGEDDDEEVVAIESGPGFIFKGLETSKKGKGKQGEESAEMEEDNQIEGDDDDGS